jgi:hypothetical protein
MPKRTNRAIKRCQNSVAGRLRTDAMRRPRQILAHLRIPGSVVERRHLNRDLYLPLYWASLFLICFRRGEGSGAM